MSPEQAKIKFKEFCDTQGMDNDDVRATVWHKAGMIEYTQWLLSGVQWQKENGWISMETELPEFGEKVLVAIDTDYVLLMGQLMTNGWAAFYLDGLKLTLPSIVTHWQKLPSSPLKTIII